MCAVEDCDMFHIDCELDGDGCPTCRMVDLWRGRDGISAVEKAREYAIEAHGDQTYGAFPYRYHLDAVAEIILLGWRNACGVPNHYPVSAVGGVGFLPVKGLEEMLILAYLHDVIEDVPWMTLNRIGHRFGLKVETLVAIVTDFRGCPRAVRSELMNERLRKVEPEHFTALIVKAADRLANVRFSVKTGGAKSRSMLKRYRAEHEAFRAAAFRPGLCDPIWEEMDGIMLLEPAK